MLNIIACPRTWEYSIIFPAYSSCVLCNDLYGMVYFLDIAEKTVPVFWLLPENRKINKEYVGK